MEPRALTPPTDAPHQAVSLWKMEPQGWFGVNVGRGRREENKRKNVKQTQHFLSHMQNLNLILTYHTDVERGLWVEEEDSHGQWRTNRQCGGRYT